jgi:hypothetical protein
MAELELAPGVSIDVRGVPDHETVARALRRAVPGSALFFVDRSLRVILAGGAAIAESGHDPAALEGRLLAESMPAASFALLEPHYRRTLETGEPASFTLPVRDDRYRIDAVPVRNAAGRTIGLYALARIA